MVLRPQQSVSARRRLIQTPTGMYICGESEAEDGSRSKQACRAMVASYVRRLGWLRWTLHDPNCGLRSLEGSTGNVESLHAKQGG